MPCYDGPYKIAKVDPEHSTMTLDIPHSPRIYPVFHIYEVLPFIENDKSLFTSQALHEPKPVFVNNDLEYVIDRIIDKRKLHGHGGWTYLVRWVGQGPADNIWLPQKELEDCEALDKWLTNKNNH